MSQAERKRIKESLIQQLEAVGKDVAFIKNIIEDYMRLLDLKEAMFDDLKTNGLTIEVVNGNGITVIKPNDNATNVLKVQSQLMSILEKMDLKQPISTKDDSDDDYM